MASEAVLTRTRAEDIEGLRALISQVILEERDKIIRFYADSRGKL